MKTLIQTLVFLFILSQLCFPQWVQTKEQSRIGKINNDIYKELSSVRNLRKDIIKDSQLYEKENAINGKTVIRKKLLRNGFLLIEVIYQIWQESAWVIYSKGLYTYFSITKINQDLSPINSYSLPNNYPNPFNPSTTIKYQLPTNVQRQTKNGFIPSRVEGDLVQLKIYDILGREVATLVNQKQKPGNYEVEWNAENYPSSVYFFRIQKGSFIETQKMILLR
jgi:hypothetical protein